MYVWPKSEWETREMKMKNGCERGEEWLKVGTNIKMVIKPVEKSEQNWIKKQWRQETKRDKKKHMEEMKKERNLPKKQYLTENQPADRTPPTRTREDLNSQHAVVHSLSSWNKGIFVIIVKFMRSLTLHSGSSDLQRFIRTHLQHSSNQRAM